MTFPIYLLFSIVFLLRSSQNSVISSSSPQSCKVSNIKQKTDKRSIKYPQITLCSCLCFLSKIVCTNNVDCNILQFCHSHLLEIWGGKNKNKGCPIFVNFFLTYLSYSSSLVKIRGGQEATEDIPFVFSRWLRNHRSLVVVTGEEVSIHVYNQQCFKNKQ